MSFIKMNLNDVREPVCAPEGEYELVVENVKEYEHEQNKNTVIRLGLTIMGVDGEFQPVYHYLSMPGPSDDDDKVKNKMRMLKRFLVAAGISFEDDGFNSEDLYGARITCKLTVEHNEETNMDNNRLVLPRFE